MGNCSVCPVCNLGVLWPNGWMPLGTELGLNPSDSVLYGDLAPLPRGKGHSSPRFSAHVYGGQIVTRLSYCWALVIFFFIVRLSCEFIMWSLLNNPSHLKRAVTLCCKISGNFLTQCPVFRFLGHCITGGDRRGIRSVLRGCCTKMAHGLEIGVFDQRALW